MTQIGVISKKGVFDSSRSRGRRADRESAEGIGASIAGASLVKEHRRKLFEEEMPTEDALHSVLG